MTLLGGMALVAIGIRALLPTLVERATAYGSRYYLGLPARVDNVDFSLLNGTIVLEGVYVGAAPDDLTPAAAAFSPPAIDPAKALLHFDRILVRLSWNALLKRTLRLTEVAIDSPSLRMRREEDGHIDLLRQASPLANRSKAASPKPPSEPWPVEINKFALRSPDVVIVDPSIGRKLLEFSLESFEIDNLSVRGGDLAFGEVGIHGPVLSVRRDLVLARPPSVKKPDASKSADPGIADTKAAEPKENESKGATGKPKPPSAAAGYRIKKVDIERAKFIWVTDEGPLDVMLTLKASHITADQGKSFPINLALKIAKGHIGLAGEAAIFPPSYKGKFTWDGLPVPPLLLASVPELAAWLNSAESSGDLMLDADLAGAHGPPALRISGRSTIEALAISDPGNKEVSLGWKQLEAVMSDVVVPLTTGSKALQKTKAHMDLVRFVEPKIRWTFPSPALDALLGFSSPTPGSGPTSKAAEAQPYPADLSITSLEILGGEIEVHDKTVNPAATSTVRNLLATAHNVHFPDPSADAIHIQAMLPMASALTIDGSLKPGNVGDYEISLQKLDLPTFSPYAMAAGASLDAGQASLEIKLKTQGALMQIDSDLVLEKLGISLHDPSSFSRHFGMPVDLAIALMSDPSGEIRLKVPIRIDEKGTTVPAGQVISSALHAAILGAVSTPLKVLGATFGKKSGQADGTLLVAPLKSPVGSGDLESDAPMRVEGIVKLLSQKPSMGLVLRGRTSAEDRTAAAEKLLIERVKSGKGLPELDGADLLARFRISQSLSKRSRGEKTSLSGKDQALFDRYLSEVKVPEDRLDALAKSRAKNAMALFAAKGAIAKRLSLGDRKAEGEAGVVISFRPLKAGT